MPKLKSTSYPAMGKMRKRSANAAIGLTTGVATSWAQNPDSSVFSFAGVGNTIYLGGGFSNIAGVARSRVADVVIGQPSL